jgi:hypothetical protein
VFTLLHVDHDVWPKGQLAVEHALGLIARPLLVCPRLRTRLRCYHGHAFAVFPRKWQSEPALWFAPATNATDFALASLVSRVVHVSTGPEAKSSLPNVLRHLQIHRVVIHPVLKPPVTENLALEEIPL